MRPELATAAPTPVLLTGLKMYYLPQALRGITRPALTRDGLAQLIPLGTLTTYVTPQIVNLPSLHLLYLILLSGLALRIIGQNKQLSPYVEALPTEGYQYLKWCIPPISTLKTRTRFQSSRMRYRNGG